MTDLLSSYAAWHLRQLVLHNVSAAQDELRPWFAYLRRDMILEVEFSWIECIDATWSSVLDIWRTSDFPKLKSFTLSYVETRKANGIRMATLLRAAYWCMTTYGRR